MESSKRHAWRLLISACLIHLVVAGGLALTNLPLVDEGFYGLPAYTLASEGKLQNRVMEQAGVPYLTGIDRVFYWMMPLGMLVQATAFKVFGFSIFTQRAVSVSCGIGTLLLWFLTLRRLLSERIAALSCLLLSFDFVFCSLSSRGRADMMSLFFGSLALAAYLNLRERSLNLALLAGNASCAVSGLIHPNGGVAALVSLAITIVYLDRKRARGYQACMAAIPYLLFGLAWAAYIEVEPSLWIKQFIGNVRYRMPAAGSAGMRLVTGELARYRNAYNSGSLHDARALRILIPISYFVAALGCGIFLRDHLRNLKWLLALLAGQLLTLVFLEGTKQGWYAVYIVPVLSALLAVWLVYLWERRTSTTLSLAAVQVLISLSALGSSALNIRTENYQRQYLPLIAFLNSHVQSNDLVFGRTELLYNLNCRICLRDDANLGAFTGLQPDFIVLDADYLEEIGKTRGKNRAAVLHIRNLLGQSGYFEVYRNRAYRVLEAPLSHE